MHSNKFDLSNTDQIRYYQFYYKQLKLITKHKTIILNKIMKYKDK